MGSRRRWHPFRRVSLPWRHDRCGMKHQYAPISLLALSLLAMDARSQVVALTFTAEQDGAYVPLDSIRITDLTQGQDTVLFFPDTVLVLGATGVVGLDQDPEGPVLGQNHPNPYSGSTTVELILREGGPVTMGVNDAMGRVVCFWSGGLGAGTHRFSFAGGTGTHMLWATANGQRRTMRMVGSGGDGTTNLTYNGMGGSGTAVYRSLSEWAPGDQLQMIGYATLDSGYPGSGLLGDAPVVSGTYTFALTNGTLCPGDPTVTDVDGHTYPVVTIGAQCWMAANLRVARYRDGSAIPNVTDNATWNGLTTGAWCHFGNNAGHDTVYGKLYNWYAVEDPRGVCPLGWHVPLDDEWIQLADFLGGESVAGGAMKTTGDLESGTGLWHAPNTGATNSSGFSGIPNGGHFSSNGGFFDFLETFSYWWTSSELGPGTARCRVLFTMLADIGWGNEPKENGFCLRCLRD